MLRLPDALPTLLTARLRQPRMRLLAGSVALGSCLIAAQVAWGLSRGEAPDRPALPISSAATAQPFRLTLPPVEPLTFQKFAPETARAINAATPFAAGPNPPAKPFRFRGSAAEEEKALTCLAASGWYEAGDDVTGEQAVMQVVLNRLRHPAFPKTVCGVVFQGAERASGCQFTFTCDGAMARRPSSVAWLRARLLARIALHGAVYGYVGMATHYHTDAVVPYWSATLAKAAKVGSHIFFRWQGAWGTPPAFTGRQRGEEQLDPRLAIYSRARIAAAVAPLALDAGDDRLSLSGRSVAAVPALPSAQAPSRTIEQPSISDELAGVELTGG